jgi:methionine-rich copper-binding protein CopC
MLRHLTVKIIASLALVAAATAALAHAQLQKAVPAVGGTVTASPREIRLKFSEGLEPRF